MSHKIVANSFSNPMQIHSAGAHSTTNYAYEKF
jgi:hypothetical protein